MGKIVKNLPVLMAVEDSLLYGGFNIVNLLCL